MDVEGSIQEGNLGYPEGQAGEMDWAAAQTGLGVRAKQGANMSRQCDTVGKKANVMLGHASKRSKQLVCSAPHRETLSSSPVPRSWHQALQRMQTDRGM